VKRDSGPYQPSERQEQRNQNGSHREESLSVTAGKFNGANEYGLSSKHSPTGRVLRPVPRHHADRDRAAGCIAPTRDSTPRTGAPSDEDPRPRRAFTAFVTEGD
jgi:hypothetical protein